eukprot:3277046-Rhodomonas_salina.2
MCIRDSRSTARCGICAADARSQYSLYRANGQKGLIWGRGYSCAAKTAAFLEQIFAGIVAFCV